MPIYVYECGSCLGVWKETHGMSENGPEDCFWCDSKNVYRKPSNFNNLSKSKQNSDKKVGVLTNEFIENSKEDLKRQKEDLEKNR